MQNEVAKQRSVYRPPSQRNNNNDVSYGSQDEMLEKSVHDNRSIGAFYVRKKLFAYINLTLSDSRNSLDSSSTP